jgi:hypothetical protein
MISARTVSASSVTRQVDPPLACHPYTRNYAISPGAVKTPMTNHQGAWDMFAGHPGGTEEDMTEAGHHYTLLAGTSWLDPAAIIAAAGPGLCCGVTRPRLPQQEKLHA